MDNNFNPNSPDFSKNNQDSFNDTPYYSNQQTGNSYNNESYNSGADNSGFNPNSTYNQAPPYPTPSYTNPQYNNTPQYAQYTNSNLEEPVSVGEWMLTWLILMIPCVNIVMIFVYAFGNCKKSKSNYFKSYLLFMLIGIALYFILFIALISAGINITQYLE